MRAIRFVGNALLWVLSILGVLCAGLWLASTLGLIQPLIVVSGSMSPGIRTGDLIIDVATPAEDLRVGDIASLTSAHTGDVVTHRVISIERSGDEYAVRMKGDANEIFDGETYVVDADGSVLTHLLTVPQAGAFVHTLTRPGVAIPLGVSVLALIALASLPRKPEPAARPEHAEVLENADA